MGSGAWDTPVLTCAESSLNGINSEWGETPFLSENKPSRRSPLVPVRESADLRKFDYGTKLRSLNCACYRRVFAQCQVSARAPVITTVHRPKATPQTPFKD